MTHKIYAQGDVNFIPLAAFAGGKFTSKDINKKKGPVARQLPNRLLIQEGEVTGHHHGIWSKVAMFRDDAMARTFETKAEKAEKNALGACLYEDTELQAKLGLETGAPVIGFLDVEADEVVVKHADALGNPTGEHDPITLPKNGYVVLGKREFSGADERRVTD